MANEELVQRGYLATGKLKGSPFGDFEELNIGASSVAELVAVGVGATVPEAVTYRFKAYKPPKKPGASKPDRVFLRRVGSSLVPVAVAEHKAAKVRTDAKMLAAAEQSLFGALALGVRVAITTNGERYRYINTEASAATGDIVYFNESRDFNPAVLSNLLAGDAGVIKDPKPLAERVWQIIWHTTKEEPKQCLLTFVEMFMLKFLSDNLPSATLPDAYRFYELLLDSADFEKKHGMTAIEYYVSVIRPQIKKLFPDKVVVQDPDIPAMFGLQTVVSSTSVINGFAFLKSSDHTTVGGYDRIFRQILDAFHAFGPLTAIDPEFKLRLYETFLKESARQQRMGQFFTPRNIVRPMIKMARLGKLADGATVLDPAAGVGGFILEPLLIEGALPTNVSFARGRAKRRVKTIGIDVDPNLHILGKANMLIHLAEALRDPTVTLQALNQVMAETFILRNTSLGTLEIPARDSIDVVLTNIPYVTQGSKVFREEIANTKGLRNGVDLRDYYSGCGLGLESYFLRYITGSLKPGARAYVVVPLGLLNRTEPGPKERLLKECNIVASIELPRNAFFNTAQPTCIFVVEKRHTEADERPDVFCARIRTIGETLDSYRNPTAENDLDLIANLFVDYTDGGSEWRNCKLVKVVGAEEFGKTDRWDVSRLWSDAESVELGFREAPITREEFIDNVADRLTSLIEEMAVAKRELSELIAGSMKTVQLSDESFFSVRAGERITQEQIRQNPGDVPVYSCFTEATAKKGDIDDVWLKKKGIHIESASNPIVTVMANGASAVGLVFVRRERCVLTDDVIAVDIKSGDIDADFLAIQLRAEIERQDFVYEAKLFKGRVRGLSVQIPVHDNDGGFDIDKQAAIASAVRRFEVIREQLAQIGTWSTGVRII